MERTVGRENGAQTGLLTRLHARRAEHSLSRAREVLETTTTFTYRA
jgi:hypothetical protein